MNVVPKEERLRRPKGRWKQWLRLKVMCYRPWIECHYCGQRLTEEILTLDHIVPLACGGSNSLSNLLPACARCNGTRGHKPYSTFVAGLPKKVRL